ncbi:hypothetical protein BKA65DRAFT_485175 [Rhexocercosporidium sp. MPI-PUGE-AT-0058]|nr:hypothetical protein BKA65DRAFT_485175 [Rhexocercosporidium sp. MPI-PUGE-AT-0058]
MKYTVIALAATIAVATAQVKNYDPYTPCDGKNKNDLCNYQVDYVFRHYQTGKWQRMTCEGGLNGYCTPDDRTSQMLCQQANESNCNTIAVPSCDQQPGTCVPPN